MDNVLKMGIYMGMGSDGWRAFIIFDMGVPILHVKNTKSYDS